MRSVVTLTTDFGTRDAYVAQLKGVLYAQGPGSLEVVDLTHEIAAQGVMEAALFVRAAWPRFPAGTIHLVVVDPGVGSARRALGLAHGQQLWLGPDNGVMSLALGDAEPAAVALDPLCVGVQQLSATFHGRDLFAPAAARLAHGAPLSSLGPAARELVRVALPALQRSRSELQGEVLHVDRYGNLISNIARADLDALAPGAAASARLHARVAGSAWLPLVRCYADVPAGAASALIGSSELLEVAVTNGHAARQLQAGVGSPVFVRLQP
jgi:S-adenosylmethionine hydrolase